MATLVFSALGTLVGGPLGGAIGALVGRQIDGAILGGGVREGPRLKELTATTSSYGTAIPRLFGRMRVPGTIVWSTDLVEHSHRQGGGKGRPSTNSYSYTVSFAVALSSRPILRLGRVWADGNLLRGAAGDLKAAGGMRVYLGRRDQPVDPLIAAAETHAGSPAYRGLAYVVFEDLDLTDFFNRIPALTFEVFADDTGFTLHDLVAPEIERIDADLPLTELAGLACEGSLVETLRLLDPLYPMTCDAGDRLALGGARAGQAPIGLGDPAIAVKDGEFGGASGFSRKRAPLPAVPPGALRYYDVDRDYLAGVQRAFGQAAPGAQQTIELPASMSASNARGLIEQLARRGDWSRDTLAWRGAELDPRVSPGSLVTTAEVPGTWRVDAWEWNENGTQLNLSRAAPTSFDLAASVPVDPGRTAATPDSATPATILDAFELPWNGIGSGDTPALFAAAS